MIKVKDVCQMPKRRKLSKDAPYAYLQFDKGYNHALGEITFLPIDLSKVLDEEKIEEKIFDVILDMYHITSDHERVSKMLAQAIINNINSCVKDKP